MSPEFEASLQRLRDRKGVLGHIVLSANGEAFHSTFNEETTAILMATVPDLALKASAMVREMDPENGLEYVRIRCHQHELMIAPSEGYNLVVVQEMDTA